MSIKKSNNYLQNIFSVTNEDIRKVITICGIKMKFKSQKLEQKAKIKKLETKINKLSKSTKTYNVLLRKMQNNFDKNFSNLIQAQNDLIKNITNNFNSYKTTTESRFNNLYDWQCDFHNENPENFHVILTDNERNTLCNYLKESQNYLEFGAGGSTFWALKYSNTNVYSVESDNKWLNFLRSYKFICKAEENGKLKFYHKFIGPIKSWGYPLNDDYKGFWPIYSSEVFTQIDASSVDTVFVDGRFRVACTLQTILNCPNVQYILIHDYTFREDYHVVEEFLDIVETIDTLVVFKIKENIDIENLRTKYNEYMYTKE